MTVAYGMWWRLVLAVKQKRTLKIDEYATIIGIAGGSFALVNQNVYSKAAPDLELSCMVLEISAKTFK